MTEKASDAIESVSAQIANTLDGLTSKYLMFSLREDEFGIPLSTIKEVIGMTEITPIPQAPKHFKGLINLRGQIISVIDLRSKLNMGEADQDKMKSTIVIVEIGSIVLGAVVDDVLEVSAISSQEISTDIDVQSTVNRKFVVGVARCEGKNLRLLLDIGQVLDVEDLESMRRSNSNKA